MTEHTKPNDPPPEGSDTQPKVMPPSLDQYERIVDRAQKEIEGVRTVYKWLLGALAIVIVFGIYFTYQSVKDFKAEIRADIEKKKAELKAELITESKALSFRLQKDLEDSSRQHFDKLSRSVEDKVDKEFQSQNISDLIRSSAISRVEEIADPVIEKAIETKLSPRIKTAEDRIASLDEEIAKASGTRDDLQRSSEFVKTVIFAQNDGRQAFDRLETWSKDPDFPFKDEALQAWGKIIDEHASPFMRSGFVVPWPDGVDHQGLSFERLKAIFQSAPDHIRLALVEYIWEDRQDISKKDKMQFLVNVMKSDKSLRVVEYAGRFFIQESKQKIKPLAVDRLVDWWEKNKVDYDKTQKINPPDK